MAVMLAASPKEWPKFRIVPEKHAEYFCQLALGWYQSLFADGFWEIKTRYDFEEAESMNGDFYGFHDVLMREELLGIDDFPADMDAWTEAHHDLAEDIICDEFGHTTHQLALDVLTAFDFLGLFHIFHKSDGWWEKVVEVVHKHVPLVEVW